LLFDIIEVEIFFQFIGFKNDKLILASYPQWIRGFLLVLLVDSSLILEC